MKYFIDSANIGEIEKWLPVIEGVTVNPFLLVKEGITVVNFLNSIKNLKIKKFIPISNIEHYEYIKAKCGNDFICKVSMAQEYYPLIKELKKRKMEVAATTVYDIIQLNHAIELGCDYSMVYIAKNEDEDFLYNAGKINKKNTLLVGASFRTKNHVKNAIMAGMDYSTISPDIMSLTFLNENANKEIGKMKENFSKI